MNRFRSILISVLILASAIYADAQIKVDPNGVNVNSQAATVVFLTFGRIRATQLAAEGCWCGELSSSSGVGLTCNPATIFGCLPSRYDLSARSGFAKTGLTDIMSIPPSVARRAYQAAVDGNTSSFFYVRRFIDTAGGLDEFVSVTCRMSGGGPRSPFSLTDVKLLFAVDKPILFFRPGDSLPPVKAEIAYNGTGRLKGRWEVVLPGEELPTDTDLLTEATLPIEERAQQRRYTQLSTFNVFLPPDGKYVLPGPDVGRLPNRVNGEYLLLLRIEATDEREGDSNLNVIGVGPAVVHSGAAAGFPLPVLRYYVGAGPETQLVDDLTLLGPSDKEVLQTSKVIEFKWSDKGVATFYRLEVLDISGEHVLSAVLPSGKGFYRAPPWINAKAKGGFLRWRVVSLDRNGKSVSQSDWRDFQIR